MIAIYIGGFFTTCAMRFFVFGYTDMDLAVYDQIIWNILHGDLYNSILGVNFLGHHAHFLAFPLAVIYSFAPNPLTLLFVQTLALGVAAFPLYLIARRCLNSRWALSVAALYLLYPGLGLTNAYEFHFTPFATLSLMCSFYFFLEENFLGFSISILATLLCQENMPLVVFAFGIYAFVSKRPLKWWLPFMLISAFYFIFCVKFLFPTLNPGKINFISIYAHFGGNYRQIVTSMIMDPLGTLNYMFLHQRREWIFNLFSPLMFISFVSPMNLLPALPLFFQHMLANRAQENDINFHYSAEIIPFIFVSFVFGLKKLMGFTFFKKFSVYIIFFIFGATLISYKNFGTHWYLWKDKNDDRYIVLQKMVGLVSPNADLLTTFRFLSHLDHRKNIYSFHNLYNGRYTLSDTHFERPHNVDEALIDFSDPLTFASFYNFYNYKNIQGMLKYYHLNPLAARDNIVFFKKNAAPSIELYRILKEAPPELKDKPPLLENSGIALRKIQTALMGETLIVDTTWTAVVAPSKDINLYVEFINDQHKLVRRVYAEVCYRLLPTQAWKSGQWVEDHKSLTIPIQLRGRRFKLNVGIFDQITRRALGRPLPVEILN